MSPHLLPIGFENPGPHPHLPGRYLGVQSFPGEPDLHLYDCTICRSTITGPAPVNDVAGVR